VQQISEVVNGRNVDFETFDGYGPGATRAIFAGRTYPILPMISDVRTILDVGANLGATTVLFACHYPTATIHSFEPGPSSFETLSRNVAPFSNVHAHPFGLFDKTETRRLYHGLDGPEQASINPEWSVHGTFDDVRLEHAGSWLEANGVRSIDILKVDTEGCELPIFRSFGELVPDVRVIYFEAHSEHDWRELDAMLVPTHVLVVGHLAHFVSKWECAYVRRDLEPLVQRALLSLLRPGRT
jgi:FkbM family methyltransferase